MNENMNLKLAEIIKYTKFNCDPSHVEIIDEAVKEFEDYPSTYNMGVLLRALGAANLSI